MTSHPLYTRLASGRRNRRAGALPGLLLALTLVSSVQAEQAPLSSGPIPVEPPGAAVSGGPLLPPASPLGEQLASETLAAAGLDSVLADMPAQLARAWQPFASQAPLPADAMTASIRALAEAAATWDFVATARSQLAARLSTGELAAVRAWQTGRNGQRVLAARAAAATDVDAETFRARLANLRANLTPEHEALLREVLAATQTVEVNLAAAMGTQALLRLAAAPMAYPDAQAQHQAILETVAAQRRGLRRALQEQAFAGFVYTYGTLDQAELLAWLDFATGPDGSAWYPALADTVAATLRGFFLALQVADPVYRPTASPISEALQDVSGARRQRLGG